MAAILFEKQITKKSYTYWSRNETEEIFQGLVGLYCTEEKSTRVKNNCLQPYSAHSSEEIFLAVEGRSQTLQENKNVKKKITLTLLMTYLS